MNRQVYVAYYYSCLIYVDLIQIFSRILGGFIHQAGIFGVKCFSIFCGLILADSKSGEILMPNGLIALGFCSY